MGAQTSNPLFDAVERGDEMYLNDHLDDVNIRNENGYTLLMLASFGANREIVRMLLDAGADVDIQTDDGWTVLMVASRGDDAEIVKMLLEAGSDVALRSQNGLTAIEFSKHSDDPNIYRMINYVEIVNDGKNIIDDVYTIDFDNGFLHIDGGCYDLEYSDELMAEDWRPYISKSE